MEAVVLRARLAGAMPAVTLDLPDFGARVRDRSGSPPPVPPSESKRAFVKFLGRGNNRVIHPFPVIDEVKSAGCHWACTYPLGKRPRQPEDGSPMFLSRLMKDPGDIIIFGRATGLAHVPDRDDATAADRKVRPWKAHYPHYVRVHHAEFVAGTMANGVSLNALMDDLEADAFVPTQRNRDQGMGNTNPRMAYRRRADVELSQQGVAWMNARLEHALSRYGTIPAAEIEALDWPDVDLPEMRPQ
jgi:hypothetical protein